MIRRQIVLTEQQYEWVRAEAERLEISINELFRRMVDAYRGEIPLVRKISRDEIVELVDE